MENLVQGSSNIITDIGVEHPDIVLARDGGKCMVLVRIAAMVLSGLIISHMSVVWAEDFDFDNYSGSSETNNDSKIRTLKEYSEIKDYKDLKVSVEVTLKTGSANTQLIVLIARIHNKQSYTQLVGAKEYCSSMLHGWESSNSRISPYTVSPCNVWPPGGVSKFIILKPGESYEAPINFLRSLDDIKAVNGAPIELRFRYTRKFSIDSWKNYPTQEPTEWSNSIILK
jgi:hypothetical protein